MRQHSRHSFYASLWRGSTVCWARQRQRQRTHAIRTTMLPGYGARALRRPDRHAAGARALYADTHKYTCKTSLVTDSAFCYRPYAAPCFFLAGTLEYLAKWVFMWWVEFDTNQTLPWRPARAHGGCILLYYAARASFISAAMPVRGDFYYFVPTFLTSHLQSIFLKLIHFPLITHLSGQSHVIYKPRPIGDNILTRPAGYWRKGFDSPAAVFTRIWRAGRPLRSNPVGWKKCSAILARYRPKIFAYRANTVACTCTWREPGLSHFPLWLNSQVLITYKWEARNYF